MRDRLSIVELLLARGAYPTEAQLSIATRAQDLAVLRLLLRHIRPVAGSTVLTAPISNGRADAVRVLLEHGFEPNRLLPGHAFRDVHDDEDYDEDWALEMGLRHHPPIHPLLAAMKTDEPSTGLFAALLEHGSRHPDAAEEARRSGLREAADLIERYDHSKLARWPHDQQARYTG
jgi:hypothetical protein